MKTICLSRHFYRMKKFGYIDAFEFCKDLKEHRLCILIKDWREGRLKNLETLIAPLVDLCIVRNYNLVLDEEKYDIKTALVD